MRSDWNLAQPWTPGYPYCYICGSSKIVAGRYTCSDACSDKLYALGNAIENQKGIDKGAVVTKVWGKEAIKAWVELQETLDK